MRRALRPLATASLGALLLAGCSAGGAPVPAPGAGNPASPSVVAPAPAGQQTSAASPTVDSSRTAEPSTSTSPSGSAAPTSTTGQGSTAALLTEPAPKGLPRGGTEIFPKHRLFGYVGYPGDKVLGRLGVGNIDDRMAELEKQSASWDGDREILPVMELIVATVHAEPGQDGTFRTQTSDEVIASWLNTARRHKAILLLDIQPGRAKFMDEVKHLEKWLKEPDVGVALDPEWAVGPGQIPGKVFGSTTGAELDQVATYLSGLVQKYDLPEKAMVYHVLHPTIVKNESALKRHRGVVLIKSVDGIGSPGDKVQTWHKVLDKTTAKVHMGFKMFFDLDVERGGRVMKPGEVLTLDPEPEYIMFE